MDILKEYSETEMKRMTDAVNELSEFFENNFTKEIADPTTVHSLYDQLSKLLIKIRKEASILLSKKPNQSQITDEVIASVIREFLQTKKPVLFTNPKLEAFILNILNFFPDYDKRRHKTVNTIFERIKDRIKNEDQETSKIMIGNMLDAETKAFREILPLFSENILKSKQANPNDQAPQENPKAEIQVETVLNEEQDRQGLESFILQNDSYLKIPEIINDPKLQQLIKFWDELKAAYEKLDEKHEQTIIEFLSQVYWFHINATQITSTKEGNPDTEAKNTALTNLNLLVLALNKQLKLTPSKQEFIENILTQTHFINYMTGEKNKKNFPAAESLLEQITSEVGEALAEPEITKANANDSNFLSKTTLNFITNLEGALKSFYLCGFNQELTDPEPQKLFREIDKYQPLITFISKEPELKKSSQKIITQIQHKKIQRDHSKNLKEISLPSLKSLTQLQQLKYKADKPLLFEDQAAIKYGASKAKYTITQEEAELIKKISRIDFTYLVPTKKDGVDYPEGTLTYLELHDKILLKIGEYQVENEKFFRKYIPSRQKPVGALQSILIYLEYQTEILNSRTQLTRFKDNDHREQMPMKEKIGEDNANHIKRETGIPFTNLISIREEGKAYEDGTMDYKELYDAIKTKIQTYNKKNQQWIRKILPFLKQDTSELERLLVFVETHITRVNKKSSTDYRTNFSKIVDELSFVQSKENRFAKNLKKIMDGKTSFAKKEIKKGFSLLAGDTAAEKADRNKRTADRLNSHGNFFTPTLLQKLEYDLLKSFPLDQKTLAVTKQYKTIEQFKTELSQRVESAKKQYEKVKTTLKLSAAQELKMNCAVNYVPEDLNHAMSNDPNIIDAKIATGSDKIHKQILANDLGEIQEFVNEAGLLRDLAIQRETQLAIQLAKVRIDQQITIEKYQLVSKYKELHVKYTRVANDPNSQQKFNTQDEFALRKIGAMITSFKKAKKEFKSSSILYLSTFKMSIEAKELVYAEICNYFNNPDNIVSTIEDYQASRDTCDRNTTEYAYFSQVIEDLTNFQSIKRSEQRTHAEDYQKEINVRKELYHKEVKVIKEAIEGLRSTLDAIKYLADHTTGHLNGNRS